MRPAERTQGRAGPEAAPWAPGAGSRRWPCLLPFAPAALQAPEGLGREALALVSLAHSPSDACVTSPRGGKRTHGPANSPGGRGARPAASLPPSPPASPCRSCPSRWHAGSGSGRSSLQREQRVPGEATGRPPPPAPSSRRPQGPRWGRSPASATSPGPGADPGLLSEAGDLSQGREAGPGACIPLCWARCGAGQAHPQTGQDTPQPQ